MRAEHSVHVSRRAVRPSAAELADGVLLHIAHDRGAAETDIPARGAEVVDADLPLEEEIDAVLLPPLYQCDDLRRMGGLLRDIVIVDLDLLTAREAALLEVLPLGEEKGVRRPIPPIVRQRLDARIVQHVLRLLPRALGNLMLVVGIALRQTEHLFKGLMRCVGLLGVFVPLGFGSHTHPLMQLFQELRRMTYRISDPIILKANGSAVGRFLRPLNMSLIRVESVAAASILQPHIDNSLFDFDLNAVPQKRTVGTEIQRIDRNHGQRLLVPVTDRAYQLFFFGAENDALAFCRISQIAQIFFLMAEPIVLLTLDRFFGKPKIQESVHPDRFKKRN